MVSDISSKAVELVNMRFQPAMGELILNRRRVCGFAIAGNRAVGERQVLFDDSIHSLPARHSRRNQSPVFKRDRGHSPGDTLLPA